MSIEEFAKKFINEYSHVDETFVNKQAQISGVEKTLEDYFPSLSDAMIKMWQEYLAISDEELKKNWLKYDNYFCLLKDQVDELGDKLFKIALGLNQKTYNEVTCKMDWFSEVQNIGIAIDDLAKELLIKKKL